MRSSMFIMLVLCVSLCGCRPPDSLRIFAASSLREAFEEIGAAFSSAHPEVQVSLVYAGSQTLRMQLEQGAAADVFASANAEHTFALEQRGLLHSPKIFATNALVVAIPSDNPAGIHRFRDLVNARRLVIGTEQAPVGRYTRQMLRNTRAALGEGFEQAVMAKVVSTESNVRLVRTKVEMGEADAAVMYVTDARGRNVETVSVPAEVNVAAQYRIGVVSETAQPLAAARFEAFVCSEGQGALHRLGFGAP